MNLSERSPRSGQIIKEDGSIINQGDVLASGIAKAPVNVSATVSIAASGSGIATVSVPTGKRYFIKSITITKGADITVSDISFDSVSAGQTANFDCETVFGTLLTADTSIVVSGNNAGASAEDLTIQVLGYSVER